MRQVWRNLFPVPLQHCCQINVQVLRRLRASLNVAQFKGVYEDEEDIHVLMEWCKGGELTGRIVKSHYSERTVWLTCTQLPVTHAAQLFSWARITLYGLLRSVFLPHPIPTVGDQHRLR